MPTMREEFASHRYQERYSEKYGKKAFSMFAECHYRSWIDREYPENQAKPPTLTVKNAVTLASLWRVVNPKTTPRDVARQLAIGEKYSRWALPAVEGILTEEYWAQRH